jgi:hypothetical protein
MIYQIMFVIILCWLSTIYGLITPKAYEEAVDICKTHKGLRHIAATFITDDKVVCNDGYHRSLKLDLYPTDK